MHEQSSWGRIYKDYILPHALLSVVMWLLFLVCYFDYNRAHGFYKVKKYGNNGKRALHKHSTDPDHLKHFNVEELSYMLPGMKIYLCPIILIQPYSQPNLIFHLCTLVSIFHMYMYVRNFLVLTLAHRFLGTGTEFRRLILPERRWPEQLQPPR